MLQESSNEVFVQNPIHNSRTFRVYPLQNIQLHVTNVLLYVCLFVLGLFVCLLHVDVDVLHGLGGLGPTHLDFKVGIGTFDLVFKRRVVLVTKGRKGFSSLNNSHGLNGPFHKAPIV